MSTQTPLLQTIEPDDLSTESTQKKPDASSQRVQSPATNAMASSLNDAESGILASPIVRPGMQLTHTN